MARIPYYSLETGDEEKLKLIGNEPRLNIQLMLGHAKYPILHDYIAFTGNLVFNGELNPILREMAIVRTGILCRSDYEVHHHRALSRRVGMTEEKIEALSVGSTAPVFSKIEQMVLRFTEETVLLGKATDETFQSAAKHFPLAQLVELGLVIGCYMMVSSFLNNFEVDIEAPGTSSSVK
jgi:4-carboxymuconolactone decarboxylase